MMQFAFEEPSFNRPMAGSPAEHLRAHAAEVMADLDGIAAHEIDSVAAELPVEAAVACGNCRLFAGVAPQVVFPAWLATTAARRLVDLLDDAAADADRLPEMWDDATGDEAEDMVAGLLHARMDAWAALLQIEDVLEHCVDSADRAALEEAMAACETALDHFDRALFAQQDSLATLADTRLLENLRVMLAQEHREPLPWWLDGRLERRGSEIDAATDRLLVDALFDEDGVMSAWQPPTLSDLRKEYGSAYVAAAAAQDTPDSRLFEGRVFRWVSPDGAATAEIVPAPDTAALHIIVDFTDAAGAPLLALVGTRCTLVGVPAVIERRDVCGEPRAAAVFAAAGVFEAGTSPVAGRPLALTVGSPEVAWKAARA